MIIKLIDAATGATIDVPSERVVLVEDLGGEYAVTIAQPAPPPGTRTVRVTGPDAAALLAYIDKNLWKGGQS